MLTPKTHLIRHKILAHLTEKRRVQQAGKKDIEEAQSTIDEIAKKIKAEWRDVDQQLNVLWHENSVIDINISGEPQRYMVNSDGIALASSFQILFDGMMIRSQIFNNYASGIFQIITGLLSLFTIVYSLTTIDKLETRLDKVENEITQLARDTGHINFKRIP
jgi:hypothetical protein